LATENLNVMFEQSCETLDDIAAIKGNHAAPVLVDESLATLQDAARIARDGDRWLCSCWYSIAPETVLFPR
jgi:hypothetical protein